jgi:AhpD family alkylhydroperoxidase
MTDKTYHLTLEPKTVENASPAAKEILLSAKKELNMIPNMYANMANAPALLSTYSHGYKLFRKEGGFTPPEQEVIFLTISYENQCDYCMAAHSVVADMFSKVPPEVTEAIRNGVPIPDQKLKVLSDFTAIMLNKRGRPSSDDVNTFLQSGYKEEQILYIILAISVKTISNYSNHVFHTPVDAMFKAREWFAYKALRKVMGFFKS